MSNWPPKIQNAKVEMTIGGTYELKEGAVSGSPFPSESEAWSFRKAMKLAEWFMFLSHYNQLKLVNLMRKHPISEQGKTEELPLRAQP